MTAARVAGALIVVGVLSLLFALGISVRISYYTPVLIIVRLALSSLALAGWFVGPFDSDTTAVRSE